MRRFLVYLLVVVLPVTGFVAGLWLTPRPRMLWWTREATTPFNQLLGVSKDGTTVVVAQKDQHSIVRSFVLFSALDGSVVKRIAVPDGLGLTFVTPRQYLPETGKVLLEARRQETAVIELDLMREEISHRYLCGADHWAFHETVQRNGLVVVGGTVHKPSTLLAWEVAMAPGETRPILEIQLGMNVHTLWLHPAGNLAALSCYTDNKAFYLAIVDLKQKAVTHRLNQGFHAVEFWDDPQRFAAIRSNKEGFFWERYHFSTMDNDWLIEARGNILAPLGRTVQVQGNHFVLYGPAWPPAWFTWLVEQGGQEWGKQIRGWWPERQEVKLVDVKTGQVVSQFNLPLVRMHELAVLPDRVIIHDLGVLMAWTSPPSVRWPQWVGVGVGVVLAGLVLWVNKRWRCQGHDSVQPVDALTGASGC